MSNYHRARAAGYDAAAVLADAVLASVPDGLDGYGRASWIFDALEAAAASVNGDMRDAMVRQGAAWRGRSAA